MASSIKLGDIRADLVQEGWEVLSEKYTNLDTPMEFQCPKGHKIQSTWRRLRKNLICPVCALNAQANYSEEVLPKKPHVIRTLSLDQATHKTGFAIFDGKVLIQAGVFDNPNDNEAQRLVNFHAWLISLIELWQPDKAVFEGIQLQEGGAVQMGFLAFEKLARLQGVVMETFQEYNIDFIIVHTATWRSHVGVLGKTRADKKTSSRNLVYKAYQRECTDDEADAILIGKYGVDQFVKAAVPIINWED